jgi:DNA-binding CsgD family transcriptional regulator
MVLGMAHLRSLGTVNETSNGAKELGNLANNVPPTPESIFASTAPLANGFDWGDEKRLWYKSPMSEKERVAVIGAHFKFCKLITRKPPGQVLYEQFERAIRRHVRLTYKQWQAAFLVAWGLDDKEISSRLGVSVRMTKTHLQAVRRKAHLTRRSQIVRWYLGL